jgi:hypothetical protein
MDHMQDDSFDEDFRTDGGEVRKQNKVDLPEAEKVDLAKVKFPGRRAVELPDAPTLDALHAPSGCSFISTWATGQGEPYHAQQRRVGYTGKSHGSCEHWHA